MSQGLSWVNKIPFNFGIYYNEVNKQEVCDGPKAVVVGHALRGLNNARTHWRHVIEDTIVVPVQGHFG